MHAIGVETVAVRVTCDGWLMVMLEAASDEQPLASVTDRVYVPAPTLVKTRVVSDVIGVVLDDAVQLIL